MPSLLQFASRVHVLAYHTSRGRLGANLSGLPILLLTTTGRRSGQRHTTPLTYLRDGNDLVVIASNGGSERSPAWLWNLRSADNAVEVQVKSQRYRVVARVLSQDERGRLWPEVVALWPGYAGYQAKTARTIPLVALSRADAQGA